MKTKIETFLQTLTKKDLPSVRPGDTVRVYQKTKEKEKEKLQIFEGIIIAQKHGKEMGATITVRKIISGVGVEKIFPIHSPTIEKIEILKRGKARRAKLYYLRTAKGKKARLKRREFVEAVAPEEPEKIIKEIEKSKEGEEIKKETSPEQKSETEKKSENEPEEK